jgi:ABC-2 type transport system ATP-binding protein
LADGTNDFPSRGLALSPATGQPALRVVGLRKRFGDVVAVDGLDLTVAAGECFGLLGPNGAGKTTTIEICEGLTPPDEGVVEVLGQRWDRDERALRERLGIQLQETKLAEKLTVEETVRLFRSFYARGRDVDDVIGVVQLDEKRGARVGKLSGGQKQRLALACALVGDPELLFLDEPTTGLDPQSRRQLWDLITELKASGRSIVLTTHYMDEAERLCDRVAIVDHGRVIALGTPRGLIAGLGAEHVVEFTVTGGADGALDAAALERLNGVRRARVHEGRWSLEAVELARAVPAVLRLLAERDLPLEELVTHSATLEDVFVSLTGRQLRDA